MGDAASVLEILASLETGSFRSMVDRLSESSVRRRWEAYRDIDWESPAMQVEAGDPRWEAVALWDPLAQCEWYRDQSPERRADIGLYRQVRALKIAIAFEAVLCEGLLKFAARLPNGHPAFRYIYHEVAEEAQHSMMFQEVINRSGVDPPDTSTNVQALFARVAELGETEPVLFFLAILSGEEAFDYLQRQALTSPTTHPLLARISRIHIIEEARHVSFARGLLRSVVPRLDARQVRLVRYQVPFVLEWTATHMFGFSGSILADWSVPAEVMETMSDGPLARDVQRRCMSRLVSLCRELGLVDNRLTTVWSKIDGP